MLVNKLLSGYLRGDLMYQRYIGLWSKVVMTVTWWHKWSLGSIHLTVH